MDGKVIHSLLSLLDEGVPIDLPGKLLRFSLHLLQGLINGDRSDGDRRVAQNPLTGFVNVTTGRKVHDVV